MGIMIANLRIAELERFYGDRFGATLPDNRAGRDAAYVVANHLACRRKPAYWIMEWASRWAPWLSDAETTALIVRVLSRKPMTWKADRLAKRIGLDYATRTRLSIQTIGAVDFKKSSRTARRKQLKKEKIAAKRHAAGATPRAMSAERTKPWKVLGVSRSTYYRRKRGWRVG